MDLTARYSLMAVAGNPFNPDSVRIAAIESLTYEKDLKVSYALQSIMTNANNHESVRIAAAKALNGT